MLFNQDTRHFQNAFLPGALARVINAAIHLAALTGIVFWSLSASAATYSWTAGTTAATWSTSSINWAPTGGTLWSLSAGSNNIAEFLTTGASANVSGPVYTSGIYFGNTATVSSSTIDLATTATFTPTITVNSSSATINSVLAGNQGVTLNGTGLLLLTGANTYTGTTTIGSGTLQVGSNGATGSLSTSSPIVDNGTLIYSLSGNASSAPLPTGGITGTGTLTAAAGSITFNGNVSTQGSQSYSGTGTGTTYYGLGIAASTVTLSTTGAGSSISLTGGLGKPSSGPGNNLILSTSAGNGPINLNISIGQTGVMYPLSSFTANAGTGAINWSGANAGGNGSESTPISLTGAINFTSSFVDYASNPLTMTLNATEPSSVSGVFSGPMSLVLGGLSSVALTNSSTFTGTTSINSGSLLLLSNSALQNSTLVMNLANGVQFGSGIGTFALGGLSGSGNLTLADTNGAALTLNSGNNGGSTTYSGMLSGPGSFNKTGVGALTFTGTNSYAGATTISGGAVIYSTTSALPTSGLITLGPAGAVAATGAYPTVNAWLNSGVISTASSGAIAITGSSNEFIDLTTAGGGNYPTLSLGSVGNNTYSGFVNPAGSNYYFGGGSGTLTLTQSLSGANAMVAGNGGLTGQVVLAATNSYTGNTIISGGTLQQGIAGAIPSGPGYGNVVLNGGTTAGVLDLFGTNMTINGLSGATGTVLGEVINSSGTNATLSVGNNNTSSTFYGVLANSGTGILALAKIGTGTLYLGGASTFTGNVAINGGLVQLASGTALGAVNTAASKITIASGATVDINGSTVLSGFTIAGAGNNGQGALINNGASLSGSNQELQNITLSANATLGGTGNMYEIASGYAADTLTLGSFTLTKTGANTFYLCNTTVTAGTINIANGSISQNHTASTASSVDFVLGNAAGASLNLNSLALPIGSLSGGGTAGGNVVASALLTIGGDNNSPGPYYGVISGAGGLTKVGAGTLNLAGSNTYTGTNTLSAGVLQLGSTAATLGAAANPLVIGGGTLDMAGYNLSAGSLSGTSGLITASAGTSTFTLNSATNTTYSATISDGLGKVALLNAGIGTLTLNGTSAYSGGTTIAAGNLVFAAASAVPIQGTILIATSGALNATGAYTPAGWLNSEKISPLSGGVLALVGSDAETLDFSQGGSNPYPNLFLGSIGNNTFSGTLIASSNSGAYLLGGGGGTLTVTSALSGSNSLTAFGAGTGGVLVLAGTNSYSGGTMIAGGVVLTTNSASLGSGPVNASNTSLTLGAYGLPGSLSLSNGTLVLSAPDTLSGAVALAGSNTIYINGNGNYVPLSGLLGGSGNLTLSGTNTAALSLSNTGNSFLGSITINSGVYLRTDATGVLPSATSVTDNGFLKLSDAGNTTLTLAALNGTGTVFQGNGTVGNNVLVVGYGGVSSTFAGSLGGGTINNNNYALVKTGSGTFTLSGANNLYTGGTTISQGSLVASVSGALSSGNIVMNDINTGANNTAITLSAINALPNSLTIANQGTGVATINLTGSAAASSTYTPVPSIAINNPAVLNFAESGGSSYYIFNTPVSGSGALTITTNSAPYILASGSWSSFTGPITIPGGSGFDFRGKLGATATNSMTVNGSMYLVSGDTVGSVNGTGALKSISGFGSGVIGITIGDGNGSGSFSGIISQPYLSVAVTKTGSGTQIFSGANSYAGGTAINGGVLQAGNASALGASTGTLTINGGTLDLYGFSASIGALNGPSGLITASTNASSLTIAAATNASYAGGISSGIANLTSNGAALQILSGSNAYIGTTSVTGGTLQFQGASALPSGSLLLVSSGQVSLDNDGAGSGGTIGVGNNITISAATTKAAINVANNGSGNTGNTVAFGVLSNGTSANALASTINFTGANGYLQTFTSLNLPGSTGNTTFLAPTTTSVTILGNVTNQMTSFSSHYDTLDLDGTSGSNAINGVIADSSGYASIGNGDTRVTKSNNSLWTLYGANTYHGPTTISGGTLDLSNQYAVQNSTLTLSGGILVLDQFVSADAFTFGGLSATTTGAAYNIALQNNAASPSPILLTVGGNGTTNTYDGVLSGAGSLSVVGAGTLVLSGSSTYSGGTTISGTSTVTISNASALGSGSVTVGDQIGNSPTLNLGNGVVFTNPLTVTSETTGGSGRGTLQVLSGASATYNGALTVSGSGLDQFVAGGTMTLQGSVSGSAGEMFLRGSGTGYLQSTVNIGTSTLAETDAGSWTISSTGNTWGQTTIAEGTMKLGANNALPTSNIVYFGQNNSASATLNLEGFNQTVAGLVQSATSATGLSVTTPTGSASVLTISSNGYSSYGGSISGPLSLSLSGTGTQLIASAGVTYTGPTSVTSGTLAMQDTTAFASTITLSPGATLNLARSVNGFASRSKVTGLITGSGTINVNSPTSGIGGGWVIFSSASVGLSNFTGQLNVNSGVLTMDNLAGVLTGNPELNVNSGGLFALRGQNISVDALTGNGDVFNSYTPTPVVLTIGVNNGSGTFSGIIHGNGTGSADGQLEQGIVNLNMSGIGTETLAGANTFSGSTAVNSGTLDLANSGALMNSTLATGGITFDPVVASHAFTFGGLSGFGTIGLNDLSGNNVALSVGNNNTSTNFAGTLSGSGSLVKIGAGTLTLSYLPSYTGNTTVSGGVLIVNTSSFSSPTVLIQPGAAFGGAYQLAGAWLSSGVISNASSGALAIVTNESDTINFSQYPTLNLGSIGTNTFSGILIPSGTTYNLGGGGGTLVMPANTLTNSGSVAESVSINGAIVSIAGSNNYTGGTILTPGGYLSIANSAAIGNGPLTINGGTLDNLTGSAITLATNNAQNWNGNFIFQGTAALNTGIGTVTLSSSRTVTVNGSNALTVGGGISGSGDSLTKAGAGTLILTSNGNSYSGNTYIVGGVLQVGAGSTVGALPTGSVSIGSGTTFAVDRSDNIIFSALANPLSGAGTFYKQASNTLTFTGTSSALTGTIDLANGAFTVPTGASITNLGTISQDSGSSVTWNVGGVLSVTNANISPGSGNSGSSTGTVNVLAGGTMTVGTMQLSYYPYADYGTSTATINVNGVLNVSNLLGWTPSSSGYEDTLNRTVNVNAGGELNATTINLYGYTGAIGGMVYNRHLNLNGGVLANIAGTSITVDSSTLITLTSTSDLALTSPTNTMTLSGTVTGAGSFNEIGTGTVILIGSNTYTGATGLGGGTLRLDFTNASAPINNIVNYLSNSSSLALGGGSLSVLGKTGSANSQQFNGLTINPNASGISVTSGGTTTLTLGAITRNQGGTVDFTLPSGGSIGTTTANANFSGGTQTIIGGYATVGGATWAVSGTGSTAGAVSALATYSSGAAAFSASSDVDASSASANPATALTINSLRFNTSGTDIVNLSNPLTVATGGILETTGVGANAVTITGGSLASGNGKDLIVIQNNAGSPMTIGSVLTGATGLTKAGPGMLMLTATNAYSGATFITGGTLQSTVAGALPATATSAVNVYAGTLDLDGFSYSTSALLTIGGGPGGTAATITTGTGLLTLNNNLNAINPNGALGQTISSASLGGVVLTGTQTLNVAHGWNVTNDLTIAANVSGAGSLIKAGSGVLVLAKTDSYAGSTSISGGTLSTLVSGGLPSTTSINFTGASTLNVNNTFESAPLLTISNSGNAIIAGSGTGTLTVTGNNVLVGNTASGTAQINMSGLPNFVYSASTSTFTVGGVANDSANESGVLLLASTNTINASTVNVGGAKSVSASDISSGTLNLGQSNLIYAGTIQIGSNQASGLINFESNLGNNPSLTIGGAAGGTSRATINIATGESSNYEPASGTLDLVTGVNGSSQLSALVSTITISNPGYGVGGNSGLFAMGGGTLDATLVIVGTNTSTGGSSAGAFSVLGGTALVQTLDIAGKGGSGAVTGTVTLDGGGLLSAQTIAPGFGSATNIFNWNNGIIANYNANYGLTGSTVATALTITVPSITMAASGSHTFWIDAGQTGLVSSVLNQTGGSASFTKAGSGLLTLTASNTYTGATSISGGTLQIGNGGSGAAIAGTSGIGLSNGATLAFNHSDSVTLSTVISGTGNLYHTGGGTLVLNAASSFTGAATVNSGLLMAATANVLSPNSTYTLNMGILDVTAGSQTIAGLTMGSGTLNLNLGNLLSISGTANLSGVLALPNLSTYTLTGGSTELMSYSHDSGSFSNSASIAGYYLTDTGTQLDLFKTIESGPPAWSSSAGGSWAHSSNWSTLSIPSSQGALATLGSALLTSGSISLDSPQTVGTLTFANSAAGYTLTPGASGNGSLTLDNTGGTIGGQIIVLSGTHSIAAPLIISNSAAYVSITSGGSLDISGNISQAGGSHSLSLSSSDASGVLSLDGANSFSAGVYVNSGTLILNGASALAPGSGLVIGTTVPPLVPSVISSPVAAPAPNLAPVPEPGTLALFTVCAALIGFGLWRRKA
jgi:autotransporter-associated beta strand protein